MNEWNEINGVWHQDRDSGVTVRVYGSKDGGACYEFRGPHSSEPGVIGTVPGGIDAAKAAADSINWVP